jgi:hypothetical protein
VGQTNKEWDVRFKKNKEWIPYVVSPVFSLSENGIVCASVPIPDGSGCADDQRARPLEVRTDRVRGRLGAWAELRLTSV